MLILSIQNLSVKNEIPISSSPQISYREQFIMSYGGLRGAVGFSLAKILSAHDPFKPIFLTTTLIMIFFTVFLQGGTIKFLVGWLGIARKEKDGPKMISTDVNLKTIDHVMAGVESVIGKVSRWGRNAIGGTFAKAVLKMFLLSGLLNWVWIERRSIQLFSSMNWTELNEIKIWTLNDKIPKINSVQVQSFLAKKFTKRQKIWNFSLKKFFLASPFGLFLSNQQPSLFLILFLY